MQDFAQQLNRFLDSESPKFFEQIEFPQGGQHEDQFYEETFIKQCLQRTDLAEKQIEDEEIIDHTRKQKTKENAIPIADYESHKFPSRMILRTSKITTPNSNFPKLTLIKIHKFLKKNPNLLKSEQIKELWETLCKSKESQFQKISLTDMEEIFSESKNQKFNRKFLYSFFTQTDFAKSLVKSRAISESNKMRYLVNTKLSILRCRSKNLVARTQT